MSDNANTVADDDVDRAEELRLPLWQSTGALAGRESPRLYNLPGLSEVQFRVGDYQSFSREMLERLPLSGVPSPANPDQLWYPVAHLSENPQDDWGTALIRAWAVVGDVLSFYQERLANDAYLATAENSPSNSTTNSALADLIAGLGIGYGQIGLPSADSDAASGEGSDDTSAEAANDSATTRAYQITPAAAASGYLAFSVSTAVSVPDSISVPVATAVRGKPSGARNPSTQPTASPVFETVDAFDARRAWNKLKPYDAAQPIAPGLDSSSVGLRLQGAKTGLKAGAWILVTGLDASGATDWCAGPVDAVEANKTENFTLLLWNQPLLRQTRLTGSLSGLQVFAFARSAGLFGHDAPQFADLNLSTKLEYYARASDKAALLSGGIQTISLASLVAGDDEQAAAERNTGKAWQARLNGLFDAQLRQLLVASDGSLFAATDSGVFCYPLAGSGWTAMNQGMSSKDVQWLAEGPQGMIYAATGNGGTFRASGPMASWDSLAGGIVMVDGKPVDTRLPKHAVQQLLFEGWQANTASESAASSAASSNGTPALLSLLQNNVYASPPDVTLDPQPAGYGGWSLLPNLPTELDGPRYYAAVSDSIPADDDNAPTSTTMAAVYVGFFVSSSESAVFGYLPDYDNSKDDAEQSPVAAAAVFDASAKTAPAVAPGSPQVRKSLSLTQSLGDFVDHALAAAVNASPVGKIANDLGIKVDSDDFKTLFSAIGHEVHKAIDDVGVDVHKALKDIQGGADAGRSGDKLASAAKQIAAWMTGELPDLYRVVSVPGVIQTMVLVAPLGGASGSGLGAASADASDPASGDTGASELSGWTLLIATDQGLYRMLEYRQLVRDDSTGVIAYRRAQRAQASAGLPPGAASALIGGPWEAGGKELRALALYAGKGLYQFARAHWSGPIGSLPPSLEVSGESPALGNLIAANRNGALCLSMPLSYPQDWPQMTLSASPVNLDSGSVTLEKGSWLLLVSDSNDLNASPIRSADLVKLENFYAKSGNALQLEIDSDAALSGSASLDKFGLRTAQAHYLSQAQPVFDLSPVAEAPLSGSELLLEGAVTGLSAGGRLAISGKRMGLWVEPLGGVMQFFGPSSNDSGVASGASARQRVGLDRLDIQALCADADTVLAGTLSDGVFRSRDACASWAAMNDGLADSAAESAGSALPAIQSLALSATGAAFAGTASGLFRSIDDDWLPVSSLEQVSIVEIVPVTEMSLIYVATATQGVYVSDDDGEHFQPCNAGLPGPAVTAMAVDGQHRLWVGVKTDAAVGVYALANRYALWQAAEAGLEGVAGNSLTALVAIDADAVLAASGSSLYLWNGANWLALDGGPGGFEVNALSVVGSVWYAATQGGGLWYSEDRGGSWVNVDALAPNVLRCLTYRRSTSGDVLLIGTVNGAMLSGSGRVLDYQRGPRLPGDDFACVQQGFVSAAIRQSFKDAGFTISEKARWRALDPSLLGGGEAGWALVDSSAVYFVYPAIQALVDTGDKTPNPNPNSSPENDHVDDPGSSAAPELVVYIPQDRLLLSALAESATRISLTVLDAEQGVGQLALAAPRLCYQVSDDDDEQVSQIGQIADLSFAADFSYTRIQLTAALSIPLDPGTLLVNANVAAVTQGLSVSDEVLGSGNGAQSNQSFAIRNYPLTFLAQPTADQRVTTLTVSVAGIAWSEVDDLSQAGPTDQVYSVALDAAGKATVRFGDGVHGARLPSGLNNVTANYRYGAGDNGNVAANSVSVLQNAPFGISAATNPVATSGGVDAESHRVASSRASRHLRAGGRLLSLSDYENFAAAFPGVSHSDARSVRTPTHDLLAVSVLTPSETDDTVDADADPTSDPGQANSSASHTSLRTLAALRVALRAAQSQPAAAVHVYPAEIRSVSVSAMLWTSKTDHAGVVSAAQDALLAAFGDGQLDICTAVHACDVIAALQAAEGVAGVDLLLCYRSDLPAQRLESIKAPGAHWDSAKQRVVGSMQLMMSAETVALEAQTIGAFAKTA